MGGQLCFQKFPYDPITALQIYSRNAQRKPLDKNGCKNLHLVLDLRQEGLPDEARPHKAHSQGQGGQVEATVHCPQRPDGVLLIDQYRDVVLAAALCNGPAMIPTIWSSSGMLMRNSTARMPLLNPL
jgi:hypothetical protein